MGDNASQQDSTKLNTLTPTQRLFVMLRARGRSVADAAKEVGIHRTTPAATWDMELISAAILEVQQQMIASPMEAIGPLIPAAIAGLADALAKKEEWAIRETFDRGWGKPTQRQEISGPKQGPIELEAKHMDYRTGLAALAPPEETDG